jgi:hypothetical protein
MTHVTPMSHGMASPVWMVKWLKSELVSLCRPMPHDWIGVSVSDLTSHDLCIFLIPQVPITCLDPSQVSWANWQAYEISFWVCLNLLMPFWVGILLVCWTRLFTIDFLSFWFHSWKPWLDWTHPRWAGPGDKLTISHIE